MIVLHLRVTKPRDNCKAVIEWIKTITNRYISCYEIATRGHSHIVFTYDKTESTFRQKLLVKFPELKQGKRNEYYALSSKDDLEANERYVCKGESRESKPDMIQNSFHYTDALINQRHNEYWEVNEKLISEKNDIKTKRREPTFVEYVVSELGPRDDWSYHNNHDKKLVLQRVMKCLGKKAKVLDSIIVKRICYGVWNVIDHRGTTEHMYYAVYEDPYERIDDPVFLMD